MSAAAATAPPPPPVLSLGWCVDGQPHRHAIVLRQAGGGRAFLHARQLEGAPRNTGGGRRPVDPTPLVGAVAFVFEAVDCGRRYPEARRARGPRRTDLPLVAAALAELSWAERTELWRCLPQEVVDAVLETHLELAPAHAATQVIRQRRAPFLAWWTAAVPTPHRGTPVSAETIRQEKSLVDTQLVQAWAGRPLKDLREGTLLRLVSARRAEHAARHFLTAQGCTVRDVSAEQVRGTGDTAWRTHDLEVHPLPAGLPGPAVDVKNTRRIRGQGWMSELCVADFKRDRRDTAVALLGCASVYVGTRAGAEAGMGDVDVLGWCTADTLARLQRRAEGTRVEVALQRPGRGALRFVPAWMFGLPGRRWPAPPAWPDERLPTPLELRRLEVSPLALWLAAGRALPEPWAELVPEWARPLWARLRTCVDLPEVYLTLLVDFLERLTRPGAPWEAAPLSAMLTWRRDPGCVLGLHDPTGTLARLVDTLRTMAAHRHALTLRSYRRFVLRNPLWVQGVTPGGRETVLTYCGGTLGRGPCGTWPLVRGREAACTACSALECPTCGRCRRDCAQGQAREAEVERQRESARDAARYGRGGHRRGPG